LLILADPVYGWIVPSGIVAPDRFAIVKNA